MTEESFRQICDLFAEKLDKGTLGCEATAAVIIACSGMLCGQSQLRGPVGRGLGQR